VERYVAEECIEFASQYVDSLKPVGLPSSLHDQEKVGKGTRGYNVVTMSRHDMSQAHLYILNNTIEVLPYIEAHKKQVRDIHLKMNMMRVLQENNKTFINWFRQTIFADNSVSRRLTLLVIGPNLNVPTWKGYDINNYSFYTKSQDDKSSVQNNGVSVDADSDHFYSTSDNNPIRASMCYYGVIQEIWRLITLHLECLFLSVSGSTGQRVCIKIRWDLLWLTLVRLHIWRNLSLWQNKPDKFSTSKIHVIQVCLWFCKEDQVESITIMMIQALTLVKWMVFQKTCLQ